MKDLTMTSTTPLNLRRMAGLALCAGLVLTVEPAHAADAPLGQHTMPDGTMMNNADMAATQTSNQPTQSGPKIVAQVNGLVCDFCVQAIQKTLMREPGVANAKVDLSAKTVTVNLKDGANLDEARLRQLLTDAGYDMTSYAKD